MSFATEKNIQAKIMDWLIWEKQHELVVPNCTGVLWGSGECDILSTTKATYTHEFEIKRTKSDYKADFKKTKHKRFDNLDFCKHDNGRLYIPNYFWFVTYRFAIDPPEYAGWISITHYQNGLLRLDIEKKAPLLHKNKLIESQKYKIAHMLSRRLTSNYNRIFLKGKVFG